MRRQDFTVLAEFKHTGTLSAGNRWYQETKLERNQAAEITTVEIFAPTDDSGNPEDLDRIIPVIDGKSLEDIIALPGHYDRLITPPWNGVVKWRFYFGTPGVRDPRRNTTLKAARSIGIEAYAGDSDVTGDFLVRFWGYLYEEDEALKDQFGDTVYGEETTIYEDTRGKAVSFTKEEVEVSTKNFDQFVGGINQKPPKVMPFVRFGVNANATTPNEEYVYRYETGNVDGKWMDMYWDLDEDEAVIILRAGVRSVDYLKYFGIRIGDNVFPKGYIRADRATNKFHFGLADIYGYSKAQWFGLPRWELPLLIHDEIGRVVIKDDGTSIAADQVWVAVSGYMITEM